MKQKFLGLVALLAVGLVGCESTNSPGDEVGEKLIENVSNKLTRNDKSDDNNVVMGGIVAPGEDTYVTLALNEDYVSDGGLIVRLEIGATSIEDQKSVWLDLNGNGERDENEEVKRFQQPAGGQTQYEYRVTTPFLRIYGKANYISCSANNQKKNHFIAADISNNSYLKIFWAANNKITQIGLGENNKGLESLSLGYNKFSKLDVSALKSLNYLAVAGNNLRELNVSNNTELTTLRCDSNKIKTLDVSALKKLEYLSCGLNKGIEINTSNNKELKHFAVADAALETLDVSNNPKLECLRVSCNNLKTIDVRANKNLKELDVRKNPNFVSVDLSENKKLNVLDVSKTSIKNLDIKNNQELYYLLMEYANLSASEMNKIFNDMPNVVGKHKPYSYYYSLECRDNPGYKDANLNIVLRKGWSLSVR